MIGLDAFRFSFTWNLMICRIVLFSLYRIYFWLDMKYFIDIRFCRIAQIIYRCVSSIGKTDISSPRKKTTRHSISNGIEAIRETRLTIVDSDCLLAILIWTGFAIERNLIANIAVEQYGWQWWVFRLFLYQKTLDDIA